MELRHHPDRDFAAWVGEGITRGFRVGFNYGVQVGTSAIKNMHSAVTHPQPIDKYVREELRAGRMIRLEEAEVATVVHVSRFGVIPKPHQKGKWRLHHRFIVP